MLYDVLLTMHSWLRWAILAAAIVVLVRSIRAYRASDWTIGDRRAGASLVGLLDLQLVIGVSLFLTSGITPHSGEAMALAMKNPVSRFFAVEHEFAALVAIVVGHVTSVYSRRAPNDFYSARRWIIGAVVILVILGFVIPWPFRAVGRPLFRF